MILKYWDKKYHRIPDLVVIEGPLAGGHLGFHEEQLETYGIDAGAEDYVKCRTSYEKEIIAIMQVIPFMKKVKELGRIAPAHCFQCLKHCNPGTTPYCITQALINAAKGKIDDAVLFCGAYAYQATHLETVKEVIDSLIPERV